MNDDIRSKLRSILWESARLSDDLMEETLNQIQHTLSQDNAYLMAENILKPIPEDGLWKTVSFRINVRPPSQYIVRDLLRSDDNAQSLDGGQDG